MLTLSLWLSAASNAWMSFLATWREPSTVVMCPALFETSRPYSRSRIKLQHSRLRIKKNGLFIPSNARLKNAFQTHADRQTNDRTNEQTNKQTNKRTNEQTNKQTNKQTPFLQFAAINMMPASETVAVTKTHWTSAGSLRVVPIFAVNSKGCSISLSLSRSLWWKHVLAFFQIIYLLYSYHILYMVIQRTHMDLYLGQLSELSTGLWAPGHSSCPAHQPGHQPTALPGCVWLPAMDLNALPK